MSELHGPVSSGRTSLAWAALAAATARGEWVALIDTFDRFDPEQAARAGVGVVPAAVGPGAGACRRPAAHSIPPGFRASAACRGRGRCSSGRWIAPSRRFNLVAQSGVCTMVVLDLIDAPHRCWRACRGPPGCGCSEWWKGPRSRCCCWRRCRSREVREGCRSRREQRQGARSGVGKRPEGRATRVGTGSDGQGIASYTTGSPHRRAHGPGGPRGRPLEGRARSHAAPGRILHGRARHVAARLRGRVAAGDRLSARAPFAHARGELCLRCCTRLRRRLSINWSTSRRRSPLVSRSWGRSSCWMSVACRPCSARPRSWATTIRHACPACRAVTVASTASAALLLACGREGLTVLEPAGQKSGACRASHRRAHRGDAGSVVGRAHRSPPSRTRASAGFSRVGHADAVTRGGVAASAGHASGPSRPPAAPARGRFQRPAPGADGAAAVRGDAAAVGHSAPGGAGRAAAPRRARAAGRARRGLAAPGLRRRRRAAGAVAGRADLRGAAGARVAHRRLRAAGVRAGPRCSNRCRHGSSAPIAGRWPFARRCT